MSHSSHGTNGPVAPLALGALGVVYGDLGTSPLYTLKECFNPAHGIRPTPENVLGILSLIFWSIVVVVALKYLRYILRADNRGEGGILSLVTLLSARERSGSAERRGSSVIIALGLFGAALLYGDGVITPTISVYSAIEGIQEIAPDLERFVTPITAAILCGLFLIQSRGSARIGRWFGPIMVVFFASIAICGIPAILRQPRVLAAMNPVFALSYFQRNGLHGFLSLGAVVLCVTGCEALYADMGHFGARAIRLAFYTIVMPASLISYFAQGALLLQTRTMSGNPFYQVVPGSLLYPMVGLATLATIVASQSLITGAFSLTRQAVQLGYFPRTLIVHTSSDTEGQIYAPAINAILMVGCLWLVFAFRAEKSSGLAAAFGLAVTATMVITTFLFALVARRLWGFSLLRLVMLVSVFLLVDVAFLCANLAKLTEGGWIPLSIAAVLFAIMLIWRRGQQRLGSALREIALPLPVFLADLEQSGMDLFRPRGTAVFMTGVPGVVPLHLLHHLKHNKMLHRRVLLLCVITERVPKVADAQRVHAQELSCGFCQVTVRYGYMESPKLHALLLQSGLLEPAQDAPSYYLGRETLLPKAKSGLARTWILFFAVLKNNARSATAYFDLPANRVVECGTQLLI